MVLECRVHSHQILEQSSSLLTNAIDSYHWVNLLYDGTINCFSTLAQSSLASNDTFHYKGALQQSDRIEFIVAMKHRIDYNGNNPLQQQILPLIPTHVSNPISSLKFIGESKLEGAGFAPTTFRAFELTVASTSIDDFQLIVSVFLNSDSEGAQAIPNKPSRLIVKLISIMISEGGQAPQLIMKSLILNSDGAQKMIVMSCNSKIFLILKNNHTIFFEGEWEHSAFGQNFASGEASGHNMAFVPANGQNFASGVASGKNIASGPAFGHNFASGAASGQNLAFGLITAFGCNLDFGFFSFGLYASEALRLIAFVGLGVSFIGSFVGFVDLRLVSLAMLINDISLINPSGISGLVGFIGRGFIGIVNHKGLTGQIGLVGQISLAGLIGNISRAGLIGNISFIGSIDGFVGLISIVGNNGLANQNDLVGFIGIGISFIGLGGHNSDISLIGLSFVLSAHWLVSFIGLGRHNGNISLIGLGFVSSACWLIGFIGLGLVGFIGLGLDSLVSISSLIGHNCLNGVIGLGLVSLVGLVGLSGINGLVGLDSLVAAIIAAAEFLVVTATQAAAAKTHGVAIKLASATKITNAAIWYYCAALLLVLLSLIWRESGLWCEWRVFSSLAGLDSVFKDALQNAKQLFHISLLQMTKYCIMRECENILCGYLYDGDLAFVTLKGIHGIKFAKWFLEISSRDLTSFLLLFFFVNPNHLKT